MIREDVLCGIGLIGDAREGLDGAHGLNRSGFVGVEDAEPGDQGQEECRQQQCAYIQRNRFSN